MTSAGHTIAKQFLPPEAWATDPLPTEPLTDLGYAHRLTRAYGHELRYVPQWRKWLAWDGTRWAHDITGQAHRDAKDVARQVTNSARQDLDQATTDLTAATTKEEKTDAQAAVSAAETKLRTAKKHEADNAIKGALALAGTEPDIVVQVADLDTSPFLLNCTNGTLNLQTGELHDHDPADLITKTTGTAYTPDATGVKFTEFLEFVQPDPEMRSYLARLLGHGLEGRAVEHILPIFWGEGGNGKGTLVNVVLAALGDYADAADPELLTAKTFDAHPTSVADLFGLRLAVLHESDQGRQLAEGTVKRLTGGDRIKGRHMREDWWHFEPSHTFLMLTNHKPIVKSVDEGIWRRLRLIPWDVIVPAEKRDGRLGEQLQNEKDAVLAWLVAGYTEWSQGGLNDPEPVTTATSTYRAEADVLRRFIDQRCVVGSRYKVPSAELFAVWMRWCQREGEDQGSQTAFSLALTNRGFDKTRTGAGYVWSGIGVVDVDSEWQPSGPGSNSGYEE